MRQFRKPIVAGSFYPSDKQELIKAIENSFASKLGPGKINFKEKKNKRRDEIKGIIAPHAGYVYSGACQAYAYKELFEANKPNLYIIIGTNHTGLGNSDFLLTFRDFETPLELSRTEKWFVKKLKDRTEITEENDLAHDKEHSIEVQLPFLQYINPGAKIIPIIASTNDIGKINKLARVIVNLAKAEGKKIMPIASSDMTHFGKMYNFTPFKDDIKNKLYALDNKAISLIKELKTGEFLRYAEKTTICGAGAIALCMEICKQLPVKSGKLLKYYTSGDITEDYDNAVGYASMSII